MNHEPWRTDRPLDAAIVRRALSEAFPELERATLAPLGSGWDFDAWLVDGRWVFRFPRRRELSTSIDREAAVLQLVAAPLADVGVEVPRLERRSGPTTAFPYPFAGYRHVPGVGADTVLLGPREESALAARLGLALARLHAIPVAEARRAGVRVERAGLDVAGTREQIAAGRQPLTAALPGEVLRRWRPVIEGQVEAPSPSPLLRMTHDDLGIEHLILDLDTRRLTGIIDWEDAAITDPVIDFITLFNWRGEGFVGQVLDAYGLDVDPGFGRRLRVATAVLSLQWIVEAARRGLPGDVERHVARFLTHVDPALGDLAWTRR